MCEPRGGKGGARAAGMVALGLALLAEQGAAADSAGRWRVAPFLSATVADSNQGMVGGIEFYPSSVSVVGGRLFAIGRKVDPDASRAEASTESFNFGLGAQLLTEFGRGTRSPGARLSSPELSLYGAALDGQWTLARYDYRPGAGLPVSTLESSWSVGLRTWWFTTLSAPEPVSATGSGITVYGMRPPPRPTEYSAWLMQPQMQFRYGRRAIEAPDSYVVGPAQGPTGLRIAEPMKLYPPLVVPSASFLFAMPIAPPSGRFAFGPAVRIMAMGAHDEWDPMSQSVRGRMEMWLYYFGFDEHPALRVGVAPFVDARLRGANLGDEIIGGAMVEVRTSTSRLEY